MLDLLTALEKQAERAKGKGPRADRQSRGDERLWRSALRLARGFQLVQNGRFRGVPGPRLYEALSNPTRKDNRDYRKQWYDEHPLGWAEQRQAFAANGKYGRVLLEHDAIVKVNDILFLHGGLTAKYVGTPLATLNRRIRAELKDFRLIENGLVLDPLGPLWDRGLAQDPESAETSGLVASILAAYGVSHIVLGHTPTAGAVVPRFGGKVILIDVGMSKSFNSSPACLIVEDGKFFALHRGVKLPLPDGADPAEIFAPRGRGRPARHQLAKELGDSIMATAAVPLPAPRRTLLDRCLLLFSDVREGEGVGVLLLAANVLLLLAANYVVKTIREPLILGEPGGAEMRSYSAAAQTGVFLLIVPLYGLMASRWNRMRLIAGTTAFFILNLAAFFALGAAKRAHRRSVLHLGRRLQHADRGAVLELRQRPVHRGTGKAAVSDRRRGRFARRVAGSAAGALAVRALQRVSIDGDRGPPAGRLSGPHVFRQPPGKRARDRRGKEARGRAVGPQGRLSTGAQGAVPAADCRHGPAVEPDQHEWRVSRRPLRVGIGAASAKGRTGAVHRTILRRLRQLGEPAELW